LKDSLSNLSEQKYLEYVSYTIVDADNASNNINMVITKDNYKEFFQVGDSFLKIFKAKDN
jgi:hypothetical protein